MKGIFRTAAPRPPKSGEALNLTPVPFPAHSNGEAVLVREGVSDFRHVIVGEGLVPSRKRNGRGQAPPLQTAFTVGLPLPCERSERSREGGRGVRFPSAARANYTLLALAILCLLTLTACGRHNPNSGSSSSGKPEQILRYALRIEPPSLDPVRIQDLYSAELLQNVYEGLVTFDKDNKIAPALAEKWEISPDRKTYTFHLRPGVKFHNGSILTADDVKFSFERALADKKSATAQNYLTGVLGVEDVVSGKTKDLAGVKVVNANTLTVTLDKPRGYILGMLAYPSNYVVCKAAIQQSNGEIDEKTAIGTGPFKIDKYERGAKIELAAFNDYRGGRPKLDRIVRPIVLNFQTAHTKYDADEVDECDLTASDYAVDKKDPKLQGETRLLPQAGTWYVTFQQRIEPVFRNPRVRMAIAQAIDRDEMTRIATSGVWPRADGFLPPGIPGYNAGIRKIPFNPANARKLLADAGFPGGQNFPKLTLVYAQSQPETAAMAQRIREDLKQNLGITIETSEREAATFFTDTSSKENVPFFLTGWIADYIDPQDYLSTMLRTGAALNHIGYSNPQFDALCDKADAESDMAKRVPLYQQADQIAVDDVALFPLTYNIQPILLKPRVKDWPMYLMNIAMPHTTTYIAK
jgi:oligopeptide transport system substrate-binding protein